MIKPRLESFLILSRRLFCGCGRKKLHDNLPIAFVAFDRWVRTQMMMLSFHTSIELDGLIEPSPNV